MYKRMLIPVDGSDTSNAGLDEALRLAEAHGAEVCLMHIVNEFVLDETWTSGRYSEDLFESLREAGKKILDDAEKAAFAKHVPAIRVMLESIGGVAADLILEQAREWRADVIIMGTHGRRGLFRLALGSDAEQVVRGAETPVILVRKPASRISRKERGSVGDNRSRFPKVANGVKTIPAGTAQP